MNNPFKTDPRTASAHNHGYQEGKLVAVATIVGKLVCDNRIAAAEYTLTAAQETKTLTNRECNNIAQMFHLSLQWEG